MGSEVELAGHIVKWFQNDGWETFEEVSLGWGTAIDLIAVRSPVIAAIEAKTSLSLAVIGQAKRWVGHAHLTYVAAPAHKRGSATEGAKWICQTLGLGLLTVSDKGNVRELVRPKFYRKVDTKLITSHLRPQQQDGSVPAGTATGARWTPWRATISDLREVVQKNPGIPMGQALAKIKHHYSSDKSARATLSLQIRKGILKGLRIEGRDLRLFVV